MNIQFYKYQGTGNDFILLDNRQLIFPKNNTKLIQQLCDRRFGIGADGLILLENDKFSDFKMVYFNSDGHESSMCGNGGRCIVAFAKQLQVIENETTFMAVDGEHYAKISVEGIVSLQMKEVDEVKMAADYVFLDTGSPHHITLVNDVKSVKVKEIGSQIRYSDLYGKTGSNINFVEAVSDSLFAVRTYERGVEDETLSCGTGVTAVAIAMHAIGKTTSNEISLLVEGGELKVIFKKDGKKYTDVFSIGPATFVFEGKIELATT
ncbi:MAG: diaminopimelate epimerase [Flavobacterium sp.]|nr:diaminopimelate epimerase [Flavobacterium sp.]